MALTIAVAGIFHETNTFAPGKTGEADFQGERVVGEEAFRLRYEGTRTSMGGVVDAARAHGARLAPGLYAAATPSGMIEQTAAESLIEEVAASVDPDADGLVLIMHGAMVSERSEDLEGACLARLRARLGREFPIAMTIDLHGNVSREMVRLADILVGYDTYPHVDMYERAVEAFGLLVRLVSGEIAPVRAYAHTGMLVVPQAMRTDEGGMKKLMSKALEMENAPGVLNVTVAGGFPYSDVPDAGMAFVVTTDGNPGLAERCAAELAASAVRLRREFGLGALPPQEAVETALAEREGPVILAEGSDNVGGGAPGDATYLLSRLTNVPRTALIVIRDERAVARACELGVGAEFRGPVGGASGELHGKPVAVRGTVRLLFNGRYRHIGPYMTGHQADMGRTAVLECGRLTIVLTERRVAPWDPGHIASVGLNPEHYHILVVKSAIAWQTAFGPLAKRVVHVDSPGCCSANLGHFEYRSAAAIPAGALTAEEWGGTVHVY
ncbi:M81 family metallopeptidase [Cohnella hongkongensis]|uniref:M81 family metallopeptidase n=1 Tax=Cohnella hongkongensis TaxID=178337 RepID=A0ABV9F6P3_9BACL